MRCYATLGPGSATLGKVEAHLAVALGVLGPALAHLDEEKEVHGNARHLADLGAGGRADLLDGLPLGAEHDLPLALALDIDGLLDADAAVGELLPVGGLDRKRIGKLLVQAEEEFLAGDLRRALPERGVGELVLGEEPGPGGTASAR